MFWKVFFLVLPGLIGVGVGQGLIESDPPFYQMVFGLIAFASILHVLPMYLSWGCAPAMRVWFGSWLGLIGGGVMSIGPMESLLVGFLGGVLFIISAGMIYRGLKLAAR